MTQSSQETKAFFGKLTAAFARIAAAHGFGAKSALADQLLAVEVHTSTDDASAPSATCFFHMCLATGRHAQFPAEPTFATLTVVSGHTSPFDLEAGIILEYSCHEFVPPAKKVKPPIHRQIVGALRFFAEADLVVHIMFDMIGDGDSGRQSSAVRKVVGWQSDTYPFPSPSFHSLPLSTPPIL